MPKSPSWSHFWTLKDRGGRPHDDFDIVKVSGSSPLFPTSRKALRMKRSEGPFTFFATSTHRAVPADFPQAGFRPVEARRRPVHTPLRPPI